MQMQGPEQAFRKYYAAMTDSDLLTVAKNRNSFIRLAQVLLAEELQRRQMAPHIAPAEASESSSLWIRLWRRIRCEPAQSVCVSQGFILPRSRTAPEPIAQNASRLRQSRGGIGHVGATEDQVSMVGTLPGRMNGKGTKIEDIAGTGAHDSLGG